MSVKEIKVTIEDSASRVVLELENDNEQGVIHMVLRERDSQFNEVSATGVVLTLEELEELSIAMNDVIQHQKRATNQ